MKLLKRISPPTCVAAALITGLQATDYNVTSQTGFNSLSNNTNFKPGDRIFLQSGQTFSGSLKFTAEDDGTDVSPIVVTSTGTGRATINAGNGVGIDALNTGGFVISNLNLIGSGVAEDGFTTSLEPGINFYASTRNTKYPRVYLDQLTVTGFGSRGVVIGGFNGTAGYNDVRITNVVSHGNLRSGIEIYGDTNVINANTNVYIADCKSYHNVGNVLRAAHGIVLGGVTGGIVERCLAYDNGQNNSSTGIQAYNSTNITIQHNEVHSNKTAGTNGATAFVLDLGVTGSVIQYNYSHDNDGSGYLLFSDAGQRNDVIENAGNVVRFNISENDGREANHDAASGIQVGGQVNAAKINPSLLLKYSEHAALNPFVCSARATMALLDELESTGAITTRNG